MQKNRPGPQGALELASEDIRKYFDGLNQRVFRPRDFEVILRAKRDDWDLPKSVAVRRFVQFLQKDLSLNQARLRSKTYTSETRYIWQNASAFEVGLSLKSGAYLSHGTAVFLHGLTDQIPKQVYLNKEQSQKHSTHQPTLSQERLEFAFRRPQRSSNYIFTWNKNTFVLLAGKHTDNLEVSELNYQWNETPIPTVIPVPVTRLERTLIDIVVRPAYAGGIYNVLDAFKEARNRNASARVLAATLKKLDYVYPYHQAIGFLMERAGFSAKSYNQLKQLGLGIDFYLAHGLKRPEYNKAWRLWIPEGF